MTTTDILEAKLTANRTERAAVKAAWLATNNDFDADTLDNRMLELDREARAIQQAMNPTDWL